MGMDLGSISSSFRFNISDFTSKVDEVKAGLNGITEAVQKTNADVGKEASGGLNNATEAMSGSFSRVKESINKTNEEIKNNTSSTNKGLFNEVSSTSASILGDMNTKMSGFKDKLFSMSTAIKGVMLGFVGKKLFDFTIGNAAQMEGFQTSFTVMMGSADKAKAKLKELTDYANNTPFKLDEVVTAGKTLMTFGLNSQDWVRNAGNLAAASNVNIQEVAMAMGRIKSGDFGEAFERMRDFGISKTMLQGQGLVFDNSGAYKGSVDKALTAIQNIVQTKYGNMTTMQAKTWSGLSSTFEDSITAFGRSIGDKAFPAVKGALTSLMGVMDTLNKNGTMDSLAKSIGNAMSGLANQIPKLVAKLPDILAEFSRIWKGISPILSSLMNGVGNLVSFISNHMEIAKAAFVIFASTLVGLKIIGTIAGIVTSIGTIKKAIGDVKLAGEGLSGISKIGPMFKAAFGMPPQVALFIAAIAIIAGLVYIVIKNWGPLSAFFTNLWKGISSTTMNVWNGIKTFFEGIGTSISNTVKSAFGTMGTFFTGLWNGIKSIATTAWNGIKTSLSSIWNGIVSGAKTIFNSIAKFFSTIWNGIKTATIIAVTFIVTGLLNVFKAVLPGVTTIFNGIKTFFSGFWKILKVVFTGGLLLLLDLVTGQFGHMKTDAMAIFNTLKTGLSQIFNGIKMVFSGALNVLKSLITLTWNGIVTITQTLWNGLKSFLAGLWTGIVSLATNTWNGFKNFMSTLWTNISTFTTTAWNNLKTSVTNIVTNLVTSAINTFNTVLTFFRNLPGTLTTLGVNAFNGFKTGALNVMNTMGSTISNAFSATKKFFTDLPGQALTWGKDMIQKFIDGIKGMVSNVGNGVKEVVDLVIKKFREGFGIHSPSTVMTSMGGHLIQGLINGMAGKDLKSFVTNLVGSLKSNFSGALSSAQLDGEIMAALGITGTSLSWLGPLKQLINFESGGDPNSINLTDSNAKEGHPSQGLMQTIPSTFATYGIAGLGGITNPIANIVAGIRYIKSRYGDISNTPGMRSIAHGGPYMGYSGGTNFATQGWKWVGENGPELMKFNGGETVRTNAESLALANGQRNEINNNAPLFHVDKIVLANDMDVKKMAIQFEFYRSAYAKGRGGN